MFQIKTQNGTVQSEDKEKPREDGIPEGLGRAPADDADYERGREAVGEHQDRWGLSDSVFGPEERSDSVPVHRWEGGGASDVDLLVRREPKVHPGHFV